MNRITSLLCLLLVLSAASCRKENTSSHEDPSLDQKRALAQSTAILRSLKNQTAAASSDFIRQFADSDFPWQLWGPEALQSAQNSNRPVFVFVGNALYRDSYQVFAEISSPDFSHQILSDHFVCCLVDTSISPDIAGFTHLQGLLKGDNLVPPAILCLTPQGAPLAATSLQKHREGKLSQFLTDIASLMQDQWSDPAHFSDLAQTQVEKRTLRSQRKVPPLSESPALVQRQTFTTAINAFSSLFYEGNQDIDQLGGLLPTYSLQFLLTGALSPDLTAENRARCRRAILSVTEALRTEGLKDHLTGRYYSARSQNTWALAEPTTTLRTQAELANVLIKIGHSLNSPENLQEGLDLLSLLEDQFLRPQIAIATPRSDPFTPGSYLWDTNSLTAVLGDDAKLAASLFSIEAEGNIPPETDPQGHLYGLNSLRRKTSLSSLAEQYQLTPSDLDQKIATIKARMIEHRQKQEDIFRESIITLPSLCAVLEAQISRYFSSADPADLETSQKTAQNILSKYWDPAKGLTRTPYLPGQRIPSAQGQDYGYLITALLNLYQISFETADFKKAYDLADLALSSLLDPKGRMTEVVDGEQILPLSLYRNAMVFDQSSASFWSEIGQRLYALTGEERFQTLAQTVLADLQLSATRNPTLHTDFLTTLDLRSPPVLAVINPQTTPKKRASLLQGLASQGARTKITLRAAASSEHLPPLEIASKSPVTFLTEGKTVGQLTRPREFKKTLEALIAPK